MTGNDHSTPSPSMLSHFTPFRERIVGIDRAIPTVSDTGEV